MPKFQQRHYVALADVLRPYIWRISDGYSNQTGRPLHPFGHKYMLDELLGMLERDNPRFDRQQFLEAIGYTE